MALVVFHPRYSSAADQHRLHQLLPVSHEYGDKKATLPDGRVIAGRKEHDAWVPAAVRMRCRKRCTIMPLIASHTGIGHSRAALAQPASVIACFVSTPDWHASGLDAEALFLRPLGPPQGPPVGPPHGAVTLMPRIGSYAFDFQTYLASTYEDLAMAFTSMRQLMASGGRYHLKIVPIGVGTGIRTRYGEPLAPMVLPAYLLALQYAIAAFVDESWVDTLEFIDHAHGSLTPYVQNYKRVRIMSASTRDVYDFSGATGLPAVMAPADAFCRIGGSPGDKNLAATMANNSNMRQLLAATKPAGIINFLPWFSALPAVPVAEDAAPAAAAEGGSAAEPPAAAETTEVQTDTTS